MSKEPVYRLGRDWTNSKLDFLELYLPAFTTACKKATETVYIDGFAGPGETDMGGERYRSGSPIIALDTRPRFDRCVFVEEVPRIFEALRDRVHGHPEGGRAELHNTDFNMVAPEILASINRLTPTFFLLDPEGLELDWASLELIGRRERADVFLLVPSSGTARNLTQEASRDRVTRWFGDDSWADLRDQHARGELGRERSLDHVIFDAYIKRLEGLGFTYVDRPVMAATSRNRPIHAWVFLAKREVGVNIANDVLRDLDRGEQGTLGI